jgi:RND family efflux transporter MFP subunit
MDQGPLRRLLQAVRSSAAPAAGNPDDDATLLRRFVNCGDQNAFELLLWRHGPMVLGVCRRLLRDAHDAEDAFQATFLALIKKGRAIMTGAALGGWLYRVAYRVALRLRAGLARRARHEHCGGVEELAGPPAPEPPDEGLRGVLDEEVNRLPARHRAAFVLCCLEGKSGAEAARELGLPAGTVSSRVTRARARLRRRLASRGLAPSAGALAAALAGEGCAAAMPAVLVQTTLEAARLFAAGEAAGGALSQQAITLVEGVLRAMSLSRLKIVTLVMLVVGFLAAGAFLARPAVEAAPKGEARQEPPAKQRPTPEGEKEGKHGPVAVQVVRPQPGGLARTMTQRCTLQAFDRTALYPRVAGVLKTVLVDIGDGVKKGQVLAEVEAPLLTLEERQAAIALKQAKGQVREAEARVAVARAELRLAKGAIDQKQAELQSARAVLTFQKSSYERFKKLAETGTVDTRLVEEKGAQLEAARGKVASDTIALENAKVDLEVKQTRLHQTEAALEIAQSNVESAEIGVEKAQILLSFTRIRAPFDGVVTERFYHAGDFVRTGEQAGQSPLLTLEAMGRMRVIAQVSERDVPFVKPGLDVEVTFDALPNLNFPAKVSRVAAALNEKTGTMRVEIDLLNPKGRLLPGLTGTASIRIPNKAPRVLLVPYTAIIDGSNLLGPGYSGPKPATVYVVRNGKAYRTSVRWGARVANDVEILSGLRPDDLVVRDLSELKGDAVPVVVKKGPGPK